MTWRSVVIFHPPENPARCRRCCCRLPYEEIEVLLEQRPVLCDDCQWEKIKENMHNTLNGIFGEPKQ